MALRNQPQHVFYYKVHNSALLILDISTICFHSVCIVAKINLAGGDSKKGFFFSTSSFSVHSLLALFAC